MIRNQREEDQQLLLLNGREIRRVREKRGYSREKMAELCGLHVNTIGGIERGERDVSSLSQTWIFAALGCRAIRVHPHYDQILLEDVPDYICRDVLVMKQPSIVAMVGDFIRENRLYRNMDLSVTAEKAGIHTNTLWNIEKGLVIATGANLHHIYLALGIEEINASPRGMFNGAPEPSQ